MERGYWLQEGGLFGGHDKNIVPRSMPVPDDSINGLYAKSQEEHIAVDALAILDTVENWTEKGWFGSWKDWRGKCLCFVFFWAM